MADNTQTQQQISALRTLQESYDTLASTSSAGAKETSVKDGNDTTIGMLKDGTYGLAAIKNAVGSANQTITVDDSVTTIELQPNVLYIFTNRTANLTITLASGQPNMVNEYHMFIEIGATVPTITWPNTVNWILAFTPGVMTTAEISILNNSAIWV